MVRGSRASYAQLTLLLLVLVEFRKEACATSCLTNTLVLNDASISLVSCPAAMVIQLSTSPLNATASNMSVIVNRSTLGGFQISPQRSAADISLTVISSTVLLTTSNPLIRFGATGSLSGSVANVVILFQRCTFRSSSPILLASSAAAFVSLQKLSSVTNISISFVDCVFMATYSIPSPLVVLVVVDSVDVLSLFSVLVKNCNMASPMGLLDVTNTTLVEALLVMTITSTINGRVGAALVRVESAEDQARRDLTNVSNANILFIGCSVLVCSGLVDVNSVHDAKNVALTVANSNILSAGQEMLSMYFLDSASNVTIRFDASLLTLSGSVICSVLAFYNLGTVHTLAISLSNSTVELSPAASASSTYIAFLRFSLVTSAVEDLSVVIAAGSVLYPVVINTISFDLINAVSRTSLVVCNQSVINSSTSSSIVSFATVTSASDIALVFSGGAGITIPGGSLLVWSNGTVDRLVLIVDDCSSTLVGAPAAFSFVGCERLNALTVMIGRRDVSATATTNFSSWVIPSDVIYVSAAVLVSNVSVNVVGRNGSSVSGSLLILQSCGAVVNVLLLCTGREGVITLSESILRLEIGSASLSVINVAVVAVSCSITCSSRAAINVTLAAGSPSTSSAYSPSMALQNLTLNVTSSTVRCDEGHLLSLGAGLSIIPFGSVVLRVTVDTSSVSTVQTPTVLSIQAVKVALSVIVTLRNSIFISSATSSFLDAFPFGLPSPSSPAVIPSQMLVECCRWHQLTRWLRFPQAVLGLSRSDAWRQIVIIDVCAGYAPLFSYTKSLTKRSPSPSGGSSASPSTSNDASASPSPSPSRNASSSSPSASSDAPITGSPTDGGSTTASFSIGSTTTGSHSIVSLSTTSSRSTNTSFSKSISTSRSPTAPSHSVTISSKLADDSGGGALLLSAVQVASTTVAVLTTTASAISMGASMDVPMLAVLPLMSCASPQTKAAGGKSALRYLVSPFADSSFAMMAGGNVICLAVGCLLHCLVGLLLWKWRLSKKSHEKKSSLEANFASIKFPSAFFAVANFFVPGTSTSAIAALHDGDFWSWLAGLVTLFCIALYIPLQWYLTRKAVARVHLEEAVFDGWRFFVPLVPSKRWAPHEVVSLYGTLFSSMTEQSKYLASHTVVVQVVFAAICGIPFPESTCAVPFALLLLILLALVVFHTSRRPFLSPLSSWLRPFSAGLMLLGILCSALDRLSSSTGTTSARSAADVFFLLVQMLNLLRLGFVLMLYFTTLHALRHDVN